MLTPQREAFATGIASGLSQAAAYRQAYPKSLKWKEPSVWDSASKLAANPEVQQRVAELTQKAAASNEITVERVLRELAHLAFFDIRKLVDETGRPKKISELDEGTARAIVGLDLVQFGNSEAGIGEVLKFKLADKGANLERLGRHLKMFTDKIELSASVESMSTDEIKAELAALTEAVLKSTNGK